MFFLLGGVQMSLLSSLSFLLGVGGLFGTGFSSSVVSSSIGGGGMINFSRLFALICVILESVGFVGSWLPSVVFVFSSSAAFISFVSSSLGLFWPSWCLFLFAIFLMLLSACCRSALVTLS